MVPRKRYVFSFLRVEVYWNMHNTDHVCEYCCVHFTHALPSMLPSLGFAQTNTQITVPLLDAMCSSLHRLQQNTV